MTNVAVIPARGGSRRIPRKNIRMFHVKPIITYSIATAIESRLFCDVIVSTDDDEIKEIALANGAGVLDRPKHLALDHVGTQEVMRDALLQLHPHDYACCIYATAPLMLVEDLVTGYERLRRHHVPYVYPVGEGRVDAGQWYFGRTEAFLASVPLDAAMLYALPMDRVCDINTPEDWAMAEIMYAELQRRAA